MLPSPVVVDRSIDVYPELNDGEVSTITEAFREISLATSSAPLNKPEQNRLCLAHLAGQAGHIGVIRTLKQPLIVVAAAFDKISLI